MARPTKIAHLFDKYGSICRPVIFWRDRIHGLSIEVSDTPHTVGGPLPECEGIGAPEMHRLVATIDLKPFEILLPKRNEPGFLPLIFNFDLNGLSTDYLVEGDRLLFDHPSCMFGADPSDPDSELPYDPYPSQFPVQKIGIDVSSEIQFEAFAELCTSQGFTEPLTSPTSHHISSSSCLSMQILTLPFGLLPTTLTVISQAAISVCFVSIRLQDISTLRTNAHNKTSPNACPAASRTSHDDSTINPKIRLRPRSGIG